MERRLPHLSRPDPPATPTAWGMPGSSSSWAGLIRVQARQHDEVVQLMALDRLGISPGDQEVYLWSAGFMTGREVLPERIAARRGLPVRRVEQAIRRVRSRLAAAPRTPP